MTPFADDHFLLRSPLARRLYHEHAAVLPIIDYHSHLDAGDLAADRRFRDLTQLWIEPDQYKHRALRSLGVPESHITGPASPLEKFTRWAAAVPQTLGNPLFHWSALELKNYFGITGPLDASSAADVWASCQTQLQAPTHTARRLLARANVECVCTSDRLLDDLAGHRTLAQSDFGPRVLPSLRADDALAVDYPEFRNWVRELGPATGSAITDLEGYLHALSARLEVFAAHGCTVSDHGLDVFDYTTTPKPVAAAAFHRALAGEALAADDSRALRSFVLAHLAEAYGRRGWVMQLHLGAQRHTSSRLRQIAGKAGGFATIGRTADIPSLCQFFDDLESAGALPKTILYTLNPADNPALAALTGSFSEDGVGGKIQFGPAWWFNDHALGIRQHLDAISHFGLLSTFIGMTTDSRSLLSMSRHEYFRRILCDYIAQQVQAGAYPDDAGFLADYVRKIAYENARAWLPVPATATTP
jgi:glucuronate isomerase